MIKIENVVTPSYEQWERIIMGMRNPMNSWAKSDSESYWGGDDWDYSIGEADHDLMMRLVKAGTEHAKFMRMITVIADVTAPLYWWKEFDTYKVGTVANSCSTMHKIAEKEFTLDDFSAEHLDGESVCSYYGNEALSSIDILRVIIRALNKWRERYLTALKTEEYTGLPAKDIWWQMIQILPSSYNQKRTICLNYAVLANIYRQRKGHKLDEWNDFCKWIETLPYSELITGENKDAVSSD